MSKRSKIGVLDSGVGGLTVVKELERVLPDEDIVYFGDNKNCPYGNRSGEDIVSLTKNMLDFLQKQDVKIVAIACNTISSLVEEYRNDYDFPIVDIVSPTAQYIAKEKIPRVGVVATAFTIKSGSYDRLIKKYDPSIKVYGEPNKELAGLIDCGDFDMDKINDNIKTHMEDLLQKDDIKDVVLGCTHYPIMIDIFKKYGKDVNFINPALKQAMEVKKYLEDNDLLNDNPKHLYNIYTSGSTDIYETLLSKLNIVKRVELKTL